MFQLILPFQLELPFDGSSGRNASGSRRDPELGRTKPLAVLREMGPRTPRARRERRSQAKHSLELPLLAERVALEIDA